MTEENEPLSDSQRKERDEQLREVRNNLGNFLLNGERLHYLNEQGLYKEHGTFEDLVATELQMSVSMAYNLMNAFEVIKALKLLGFEELPLHESHCRELHALLEKPRQMADVWESVLRKGRVTAEKIKAEIALVLGETPWRGETTQGAPERHRKTQPGKAEPAELSHAEIPQGVLAENGGPEKVHNCGQNGEPQLPAGGMTHPTERPSYEPPLDVMANAVILLESVADKVDADPAWKRLGEEAQAHVQAILASHEVACAA
jgi:hypothetical protein